jgi:5-methyltetrahydropteroyltriglutamate--homocysteine methyltransferase
LLATRRAFDEGTVAVEALHAEEDRWIREAVTVQESVGLQVITDGEYRRIIYFGHFPAAVSGFTDKNFLG